MGGADRLGGRLDAGVHVVVLDLGDVPLVEVDDVLEYGQRVVKGEPDVAHQTLRSRLLQPIDDFFEFHRALVITDKDIERLRRYRRAWEQLRGLT